MGFPFNAVTCPIQRALVVVALAKGGLGTPTISGLCAAKCSIVDNGVGDYTIVFPPMGNINFHVAVTSSTDGRVCRVGTKAINSVQILVDDDSGSAAEGNFDLIIIGTTARDLQG